MNCAHCGQPATLRIPTFPDAVCTEHAIEFWTGLLKFARDARPQSGLCASAPCECWTCNDLCAARALTAAAA
jgi:hypothetical protein